MGSINFFTEDTNYTLKQKIKLRHWIKSTIEHYLYKLEVINYIFTSDKYLLELNKEYLAHNTFTDIITFNQSSEPKIIAADIYISIERIKENAKKLNLSFSEELHRVMIHGVLHLLGFTDKEESEKEVMRKKENHYLALLV
jgi:probable rRNA maturation factor